MIGGEPDVLDDIYEAAFTPELWPSIIARVAERTRSMSGALLIIDRRLPPLYSATPNVLDTLEAFAKTSEWYDNRIAQRLHRSGYAGFLERGQYLTDEERSSRDAYNAAMTEINAGWQAGTTIAMPGGELVVFTFERKSGLPDFDVADLAVLDALRPHFARATLLAAKLKLKQAQASVATMAAVGVPAAVVGASGAVIATNSLLDGLNGALLPAAFGKLAALNPNVNRLLQAALPQPGCNSQPEVRSIPLHYDDHTRAAVIHVIPLRRSASDIFDRGSALVAVTGYAADGNIANEAVLRGLFDLSPGEVRVALKLQTGHSVAQAAEELGISVTTVRTHLAQIFRKTGTSHQGQLISLLKGTGGQV
jgi:DNA-binding CsgD family transcriptional regulator